MKSNKMGDSTNQDYNSRKISTRGDTRRYYEGRISSSIVYKNKIDKRANKAIAKSKSLSIQKREKRAVRATANSRDPDKMFCEGRSPKRTSDKRAKIATTKMTKKLEFYKMSNKRAGRTSAYNNSSMTLIYCTIYPKIWTVSWCVSYPMIIVSFRGILTAQSSFSGLQFIWMATLVAADPRLLRPQKTYYVWSIHGIYCLVSTFNCLRVVVYFYSNACQENNLYEATNCGGKVNIFDMFTIHDLNGQRGPYKGKKNKVHTWSATCEICYLDWTGGRIFSTAIIYIICTLSMVDYIVYFSVVHQKQLSANDIRKTHIQLTGVGGDLGQHYRKFRPRLRNSVTQIEIYEGRKLLDEDVKRAILTKLETSFLTHTCGRGTVRLDGILRNNEVGGTGQPGKDRRKFFQDRTELTQRLPAEKKYDDKNMDDIWYPNKAKDILHGRSGSQWSRESTGNIVLLVFIKKRKLRGAERNIFNTGRNIEGELFITYCSDTVLWPRWSAGRGRGGIGPPILPDNTILTKRQIWDKRKRGNSIYILTKMNPRSLATNCRQDLDRSPQKKDEKLLIPWRLNHEETQRVIPLRTSLVWLKDWNRLSNHSHTRGREYVRKHFCRHTASKLATDRWERFITDMTDTHSIRTQMERPQAQAPPIERENTGNNKRTKGKKIDPYHQPRSNPNHCFTQIPELQVKDDTMVTLLAGTYRAGDRMADDRDGADMTICSDCISMNIM